MKHTPLKIGPAAHHPIGVSLMHRPLPEHVPHLSGHKHSTTTTAPAGRRRIPKIFKR